MQDSPSVTQPVSNETNDKGRHGCPLDKNELGRSTWNLLHTMAAVYPDNPSDEQKQNVKSFFNILSQTYPCDVCAKDLVTEYVTLNYYYAITNIWNYKIGYLLISFIFPHVLKG